MLPLTRMKIQLDLVLNLEAHSLRSVMVGRVRNHDHLFLGQLYHQAMVPALDQSEYLPIRCLMYLSQFLLHLDQLDQCLALLLLHLVLIALLLKVLFLLKFQQLLVRLQFLPTIQHQCDCQADQKRFLLIQVSNCSRQK